MSIDTHGNSSLISPAAASRDRRRPVLAVRALVGGTSWLGGILRWHDGGVVWVTRHGQTAPGAAELGLAQRRLNKIARYGAAADQVLGDSRAWVAQRRARLELAKHLRPLATPDLPGLAQRAPALSEPEAQRLVSLLAAEALCVNGLPASPAAALLACRGRAEAPLRALLGDQGAPPAGRALGALTLGALHAAAAADRRPSPPQLPEGWLRRAYDWGRTEGLPADPGLIVALLADPGGPALAHRYLSAAGSLEHVRLPAEMLRGLLCSPREAPRSLCALARDGAGDGFRQRGSSRGVAPAILVALVEAAAAAEPLLERVQRLPRDLLERRPRGSRRLPRNGPWYHRRDLAVDLRREREPVVTHLGDLLAGYVQSAADPAVARLVVRFIQQMLELGGALLEHARAAADALQRGLKLPVEQQRLYLEALVEQHGRLWDRSTLRVEAKPDEVAAWHWTRREAHVGPALALLRATGDAGIVREALELDVHAALAGYRWRDPGLYRFALGLVRDLHLSRGGQLPWRLYEWLDGVADSGAARRRLRPLLDPVMAAPPSLREHFLECALEQVPQTRPGRRDALPRLARHLPRLIASGEKDEGEWCLCGPLMAGAIAIDRAVPAEAEAWLEWLLSCVGNRAGQEEQTARSDLDGFSLSLAIPLAVALADGDLGRFQSVFRAALEHRLDHDLSQVEQGLSMAGRFPALRAVLARRFPQQPRRCVDLLVRLGLAERLGPEALAPLARLEPGETADAPSEPPVYPAGWQEVLDVAPELEPVVAAYVHARRLGGGNPEPPAGVRRAIQQPRQLAQELAYLERLLAAQPERAGLAARARTLRARLVDELRERAAARAEAAERLAQATSEAQLAAAEALVLSCYRGRLAQVAGPLPPDRPLDDDLLNAILLTADVTHNRRLLRRLLCAHLAGERHWRERHPANALFLERAAARGLDTSAWLARQPRVYRCDGVAGGRVRLCLENDPLRILQMGNYFDTCLSVRGGNSFSTVANACELNKRVIYATDARGRVVGRKLIAIDDVGALVGFRTYTALSGRDGRAALERIFRRYVDQLAQRCGLRLADSGRVPTLFAQQWYDDGTVPWDGDGAARAPLPAQAGGASSA